MPCSVATAASTSNGFAIDLLDEAGMKMSNAVSSSSSQSSISCLLHLPVMLLNLLAGFFDVYHIYQ